MANDRELNIITNLVNAIDESLKHNSDKLHDLLLNEVGMNKEEIEYIADRCEWKRYIKYLRDWATKHEGAGFKGMSPASFDEWQDDEDAENAIELPTELTISLRKLINEEYVEDSDVDDEDAIRDAAIDWLSDNLYYCIRNATIEIAGDNVEVTNIDWDIDD